MPEPTYTLDEARAALARQECREYGHDYEHVETVRPDTGERDLTGVFCPQCRRSWPVADPGQQPADAEQVRAEERAAIARVRALHRVHRCAVDGHLLARTPTPCHNDGWCECGHRDPCPTIAALDTPEDTCA